MIISKWRLTIRQMFTTRRHRYIFDDSINIDHIPSSITVVASHPSSQSKRAHECAHHPPQPSHPLRPPHRRIPRPRRPRTTHRRRPRRPIPRRPISRPITSPHNNIHLTTRITSHKHPAPAIKRQPDRPKAIRRTPAHVRVREDRCNSVGAGGWGDGLAGGGGKGEGADVVAGWVCAVPGAVEGYVGRVCLGLIGGGGGGEVEFYIQRCRVRLEYQSRASGGVAVAVVCAGLGEGGADAANRAGVEDGCVPCTETVGVPEVCALGCAGGAVEVAEEIQLFAWIVC